MLFDEHPGRHNFNFLGWTSNGSTERPIPADAGRSHGDYLEHMRQAQNLVASSDDPAQVWASLAIAAATNRVADLLEQQGTGQRRV